MPLPEQLLGRYRVVGRIATGALGTVLAGIDERSGRDVALKLFDGAQNNHATWVDELRLAARLNHPNIAACLDAGEDRESGYHVLVFARALGGSLRRALVRGIHFDHRAVIQLFLDVGAALAHAHAHQIIHRDVKPENILALAEVGRRPWALTDFGAGRFLARGTTADTFVGSRLYMAPEILRRAADPAADQYSLGILGVELLAGELPGGDLRGRFLHQHLWARGLPGIIARMIDPNPTRRFGDIDALLRALRQPNPGPPPQTILRGGERLTIEDSKLHASHNGELQVARGRLGRTPEFVNTDGDEAPLIRAGRRLITRGGGELTTVLTGDHRLAVLAASLRHQVAWLRSENKLTICNLPFGTPKASIALPTKVLDMLATCPRTIGAIVSPNHAVFAWPGARELLACRFRDGKITLARKRLSRPIFRFQRVQNTLVALAGDHLHAALVAFEGESHRELAQIDVGADAVEINLGTGEPTLTNLVPSFAKVHAQADTLGPTIQGGVP